MASFDEKIVPDYNDVISSSKRLSTVLEKATPIFTSSTIDDILQAKCFFKCENFQRSGSFKFRGAYSAMSNLNESQKQRGVVAFSSGNHAQAIALAGKILGTKTTIIMPNDAPSLKVAATRGYGGEIIFYDRIKEDRAAIGRELAEKKGMTLIHPYDNKFVISGQGTAAKELFESVGVLDYLFVCVGGGGLISGSCLSANSLSPNCKIIGVEPEAGNDAQQSLEKGEIICIETPKTIADGAQTQQIGILTFEIMKKYVTEIITVSDNELVECMRFSSERMKMIVEPTGCLGIAGLLNLHNNKKIDFKGLRIGVIVSGGNVDLNRFAELVSKDS